MRFKSTHNIFVDLDEVFDPNWMDSDKVIVPPNPKWDYSRELQIEDIDIWEVILEHGGGVGVYAAWCPYAEFYLFRTGYWNGSGIETFYGPGAQKRLLERLDFYKIPYSLNELWVEPEEMHLYR